MKFVKRKGGIKLKMLAGQIERHESVALSYFKKLCDRISGRLVHKQDVVSCIKETDAVGTLDDYADEFYSFVNDWKFALRKPVEIVLESRMLGGWSEVASVTYNPKDDEFSVYARLYSEYGTEPTYVEDVKDETIERKERLPFPLDVEVKAEGDVDQNPATDEYVGVGEAWASLPRGKIRSAHVAPELREVIRKVIDLAGEVAEEAHEKLIIPAEYGEEW
ncbi:MAG: hypothetical protein DRJ18_00975 [Candidatus Methanomethylicota archaeon]|nr:MAG: hypothetical protein DRJ18_00975 [Candidatus Verstraetearchaeota archaeon]